MRVYSLYRKNLDLLPLEIEISLVPGLPAFHITGLPDAVIKESLLRLKSALRHQGFTLPTHEQVIFHLRPSYERKTSQGLDLALAAAYLFKTGQLVTPEPAGDGRVFLYGELSLEGAIKMPDDLDLFDDLRTNDVLLTGPGQSLLPRAQSANLRALGELEWREGDFLDDRGPGGDRDAGESLGLASGLSSDVESFCKTSAWALTVAATGEHNIFMAGPGGSGKTSFARALHSVLRAPTDDEKRKIIKIGRFLARDRDEKIGARPFVAPHHGSSDIALLGGGVPVNPGEITRAHHGVLLLDEFLEFHPHVVESLREPIERHEITLLRKGVKTTLPANFLLVATTNLCPCGEFIPNQRISCSLSKARCRIRFHRISMPLLDRFEVVTFTHTWSHNRNVTLAEIRERVRAAQDFARQSRGQALMNSRLGLKELEPQISSFARRNLMPEGLNSQRRRQSLFRVARSIADLAASDAVKPEHLEQAVDLTYRPFQDFKRAYN